MAPKSYHHGDLPAALRAATAELVIERGTSGFSLREVARRAGVSHAAPAHHFGDADGLLLSVATEGFTTLAEAIEQAAEGKTKAADRLRACGGAFVKTALAYPGHFAVIFQSSLDITRDSDCLFASQRAYGCLLGTVEMIKEQINPELDTGAMATLCLATVQGLVGLEFKLADIAKNSDTELRTVDELLDQFVDMFIAGCQPTK